MRSRPLSGALCARLAPQNLYSSPVRRIEESHELITPTGAALLAEFSSAFGPFPKMKIEKIGYGLGTRDSAPPECLRAVLGESDEAADADADEIIQIETNLDDLSPELAAAAMERLFAAGALDAFFTAAQMKKPSRVCPHRAFHRGEVA